MTIFGASIGLNMCFFRQTLLFVCLVVPFAVFGQPNAIDDASTTQEDVDVTFSITANDQEDPTFGIDPSTIDLDPTSTSTIEDAITTPEGDFSVDDAGVVTFSPAQDFFGTANASYTIKDLNTTPGTSNIATITVTVSAVNDLPTITAIADQTIDEDGQTSVLDFTIDDVETSPVSLTVTGASDNQALVPDANIVFGGSGGDRTVQVTPLADANGVANITVRVNDGTDDATIVFEVTVTAVNDVPTITAISDQTINEDESTALLPFTIGDIETAVTALTVTGTSDNTTLVPDLNIVLLGTGASRTVQVTPAPAQTGVANITITVNDGDDDGQTTFQLTVSAAANENPTITSISNQTINEDNSTSALAFTVGDAETAVGLLVVTGSSDNASLIPSGNVVIGGSGASRNVTVTPAANQNGTAIITLTVDDGAATAQTTFQVTVNAVNDLPTITSIANQTINENNSTGALSFTVGDVETAPGSLNVTGSSDNTALVPNVNIALTGSGANRTVNVTPLADQSGVAIVTLIVSDGTDNTQTTFQVTVNAVDSDPTISTIADQTINEDNSTAALAFTVNDADTPAGSLVVTGSSDNTSLIPDANVVLGGSGSNRTVTVTPLTNQNGVANITLTVDDGTATAQTTFQVTVNAVNDSPTITAISNQAINEDGQTGNLAFTIADVETAAPSLTVTRGSSNTALVPVANITLGGSGANRTVNVVPAANQSGSTVITLTVSDGVNNTPTTFQVSVAAVNDVPSITSISDQTIDENTSTAALPFTIGDVETAPGSLTLSASSGNPALVPNGNVVFGGSGANRTVTVTPATNQSGTAVITLTVSDGVASAQSAFQLTVNAIDNPPTITSIANQTINEDTQTGPLSFTIGDDLTPLGALTLTPVSSNLGLVPNSNVVLAGTGSLRNVNVIPLINQNGVTTITLTVSDGSQTAQTAFMVTVSALDDPPTISPVADQTINEDSQTGLLAITLTDPDTDPATLTLTGTSDNLGLVPNANIVFGGSGGDRTVQVTPLANENGEANITITVSDGTDTEQIIFKVTVTPVNDLPTITPVADQTISEDSPGTGALAFTIGDLETPGSLAVTRSSSNTTVVPLANVVLGGSGLSRTVTVTPAPNQFGTSTITLIVDDGSGGTAQTQFDVTVSSVNDLPQITAIADQTIGEDAPLGTGALAFTVADLETPVASLTLAGASTNTTLVPVSNIVFGGSGASRTVTVTPAANQSGTSTITVTVNDGTGTANTDFLLTVSAVNDVPTITTISDQTINEDAVGGTGALSFTVGDQETAPGSLTVTRTSSNPTVVPLANVVLGGGGASRTVTVTPALNQNGTTTITLTVSDGTLTSQTTFDVNVTSVNDVPTITAIADQTIDENTSTGPLSFTIGDVETPVGSLTISTGSTNTTLVPLANIVIGGSGASRNVNVTPVVNENGVATISITVSDGTTTATSEFDVTVTAIDNAPTITAIADQTIDEDNATSALSFTIGDTDTPVGSLTLSGSSSNTTLVPNSNIVFGGSGASRNVTVTPASNQNGVSTITVNVSDGTNTTPESFVLTVNAVNDAPTVSAIADQTVNEDTPTGDIVFTIADAETAATGLTVTANSSNTAVVPNANITLGGTGPSRTINIAPAGNQSGVTTITINVSDGSITTPRTFQVTVTPANDPPSITAIGNQTITEDTPTAPLAFTIGDVETPVGSLTVTQSSSNTILVPIANVVIGGSGASRTVTVTPATNQTGTTTITLTVDDGTSTTSTNFTVNVTPVNDPPTITSITNRTINEDSQTGNIAFTIGDPETAAGSLTVTGSSSNTTLVPDANIVLGGTGATRTVNIIPAANQNGTVDITLNVSDGLNSTPTTFQVSVTAVNDVPQITSQVPVTINESEPVTLTVSMLTIVDPDNVYPTDFTLFATGGTGYSIQDQTTIIPNQNVNGVISVPVFVSDGTITSLIYQFQITVNSTNNAPQITGQATLTVQEDQNYNLQFTDLTVSDPDNNYPTGFTMEVLAGTNYTFSGVNIIPAQNFNGSLSVNVRVNDGQANSNTFPLVVTVNAVNDPPVITNQAPLSTNEEVPLTLVVGNFTIADPEPTTYTLTVQPSASPDYTVAGNQITPALNFSGILSVPVTVSDGALTSAIFNAQITVSPVNDAPQIVNQLESISTIEDIPVTLQLSHLQVTDVDNTYPTGFTLTVYAGPNYTFSGTQVTPNPDYVGPLNVVVSVSDGVANSPQFQVLVDVTDDADAPVITGQNTVAFDEDTSREIELTDLVSVDPDTQPSQLTVIVQAGTNYTLQGNIVVPLPNFFGTLTVPVIINDGEANSNVFPLQVQVNRVNDRPTFNAIGNVMIVEDAAQQSIVITGISPGPLETEPLLLSVVSDNTELIPHPTQTPQYNGSAATATITFKPEPNMSGVANITVTVTDPDFLPFTRTFSITVNPINDPPTLQPIPNTTISEDAPEQIINLTGISPGGGTSENNQTVDLITSVANSDLFEVVPITEGSGATATLKFKTKANANGTTQITVKAQDNGTPIASLNRTFTLTITPVNDAPVFVTTNPPQTAEPGVLYSFNVEVVDVDGESIVLTAPTKPAWLTFVNGTNGMATLSGIPPQGPGTDVAVLLQATDPTGPPVELPFTITINSRPVLNSIEVSTNEDTPHVFSTAEFSEGFTDADGNPLAELQITVLPKHGTLTLANNAVSVATKIAAEDLANLVYTPNPNSKGLDTIRWNAADGFMLYSSTDTFVAIEIKPINDAPVATIPELHDATTENDTIKYELGSESIIPIMAQFEGTDPDGDNIVSAEVRIESSKYRPENEILGFTDTPNITGDFNPNTGVLTFNGSATTAEYTEIIRSVTYQYEDARELILDTRNIYVKINDGQVDSNTEARPLELIYTFSDLDIPTAFTPNGDTANETWLITSANGTAQYDEAEIKVYNKRGMLLFETRGFEKQWDGVWNGEILPSDTYFYTIELNYNKVRYKGTVTIMR